MWCPNFWRNKKRLISVKVRYIGIFLRHAFNLPFVGVYAFSSYLYSYIYSYYILYTHFAFIGSVRLSAGTIFSTLYIILFDVFNFNE